MNGINKDMSGIRDKILHMLDLLNKNIAWSKSKTAWKTYNYFMSILSKYNQFKQKSNLILSHHLKLLSQGAPVYSGPLSVIKKNKERKYK